MANALQPDAIVSHPRRRRPGDRPRLPRLYSSPPLNQAQAGPSVQFAQTMRDQLQASGCCRPPTSAQGGLNPRSDIAGLNLAQYPSILVELGNMKNPADAALIETPEGRQKYADAVVRGIAGFLRPPASATRLAALDSVFFRFSSTSAWILLQPQRRERLLEEALHTARALPGRLDGDREPVPAGATVQLVTIDRVGVLLDDGVAGDVDVGLDVAHPRLGGLQLPGRRRCPRPGRPRAPGSRCSARTGSSGGPSGSRRRRRAPRPARR